MTADEIYEALDEVFQDAFDDDSIHVEASTTANDIEDWDSLAHIDLVMAIEERFGVKFTMGEVTGMQNVGEMVGIIQERMK